MASEPIQLKCVQNEDSKGSNCDYENVRTDANSTFKITTLTRSYIVNIAFHNSSLHRIPGIIFETFYNAISAKFVDCGISEVTSVELKAAQKLLILDLQKNNISEIRATLFVKNVLSELYLDENSLQELNSTVFQNLGGLHVLSLRANRLVKLANDIFRPLMQLEKIDLSFNQLKFVSAELFKRNTQIESIVLSNNRILSVANAFNYCENLKVLDVSSNKLKEFDVTSTTIDKLIINKNELDRVHLNRHLRELIADENKIVKLTCDPDLSGLRVISLRNNNLSDLSCITRMSGLHDLILSGNGFGLWVAANGFKSGAFDNLINIQRLDISYNHLRNIQMELFANLFHLEVLNIDGNNLTTLSIDPNFFYKMLHFRQLSFSDNNLTCAEMQGILRTLNEHTIDFSSPYTPANGTQAHGRNGCHQEPTSPPKAITTRASATKIKTAKPTTESSPHHAEHGKHASAATTSPHGGCHHYLFVLMIIPNVGFILLLGVYLQRRYYSRGQRGDSHDEVVFLENSI